MTQILRPDTEELDALPHVAPVPDLAELAKVSAELETQAASAAVRWAWETYKDEAVLAASFQDCVLIDVAMQVAPDIEVVFLDTQYHFAETLWYVDQVRERYDLNLRDHHAPDRPRQPLAGRHRRVLRDAQGRTALAARSKARPRGSPGSGVTKHRRGPTAPIVGWDIGRGIVKVNPLAPWSHDDIDALRQRPRSPAAPAPRQGLPVHRVLAVHAARGRRRRPTRRQVGRLGQARVRPPRLDAVATGLSVHEVAVTGFGSEAAAYERARPSYPPDAVAWLARSLPIAPGRTVADVAAGTGKFTRLIAPYGARRARGRTG